MEKLAQVSTDVKISFNSIDDSIQARSISPPSWRRLLITSYYYVLHRACFAPPGCRTHSYSFAPIDGCCNTAAIAECGWLLTCLTVAAYRPLLIGRWLARAYTLKRRWRETLLLLAGKPFSRLSIDAAIDHAGTPA